MNLHRVNGAPDWASVPENKRNDWQELAAATHGVLTPGNFLSLLGLASVPFGLWLILGQQDYAAGVLVLALGRLCDLADGWAADTTGTKSPLGEKIDATFDKVSTGAVLIGLLVGGLIPAAFFVLLVLPHLIIAAVALLAYRKARSLHPSRDGKLSMGFGWGGLVAALLSDALYHAGSGKTAWESLWMVASAAVLLSFALGMRALFGYIREYRTPAGSKPAA